MTRFTLCRTFGAAFGCAVVTSLLVAGCAMESSDNTVDYEQIMQEVVGECTTTNQCKQMYSGATDCKNSEGGVCYCGNQVCAAGPPPPPPPSSGGVEIPALIEAESFDAAQESTAGNSGGQCTSSVNANVDIQSTTDPAGGTCNIGWTAPGEWLEYDVDAGSGGAFDVTLRLAAKNTGQTVTVRIDGTPVGTVTSPANGWQSWQDRTIENVSLPSGAHTVRVTFDSGSTNLNYLLIEDAGGSSGPTCNDGQKNGSETDVDCGGSCSNCQNGDSCSSGSDCSSGNCSSGTCQAPSSNVPWRVGVSADGNQHDADDWHASPMALALLHEANMKNRLVHFDYNNHLGNNNGSYATKHRNNINAIKDALGFSSAIFYDDQQNLNGAVQSIASAINASSANNRFFLICAGPMEVCWRGIDAAQDGKEQYVTAISHSGWNDNHADTSQMNHTWNDIKNDFNVVAHHINDQNPPAFQSDCSSWSWLNDVSGYGSTLYDVVCTDAKAGDASDAGMMYYLIDRNGNISGTSGSISPSMQDVKDLFGVSGGGSGGSGGGSAGECTTTSQCQQMYSGATDCRNSEGGICYCGSSKCGG